MTAISIIALIGVLVSSWQPLSKLFVIMILVTEIAVSLAADLEEAKKRKRRQLELKRRYRGEQHRTV